MPHSVISDSSTSSASRRAKTRQYYTVSKTSQIDESLFGPANKNGSNKNTQAMETREEVHNRRGSGGKTKKKQKEEVQVITKDLIRKLIVPGEDPSGQSVVLPFDEYRRIMNAAKTMSHEEKVAELKRRQEEKQKQQDASNEIKLHMQALDRKRQKNEKLSDLELEAKEQGEYLLAKAREQQEEQEDEIKHLNELMLNAKCHAIRDAQILEKGVIKEETTYEEKRLDAMMEVDRQKALQLQEEIEEQRKIERYEGKTMILTQISQREEERLLQQEKKDQEAQQMLKYLEKLQMEDLKDLDKKRQIQVEAQKEIHRSNEEAEELKRKKQEQEKLADLKVNEYMKQKAEREAAYEAEQERIRIEKEKEIARLRALQERAKDYQAEKDAQRAKRNQEERERDWRRKEKEEAIIKTETERMLKEAREVQVQNKDHFLAVQAQRERAEFERVLRAQQEAMEKDRMEEEETKHNRLTHADDVRKQIREKEQLRVSDRNAFFEEGVKINDEARDRRAKLDAIKKKKLGALRDAGVPDKYCAEVERKTMAVKH
ncbi:cilia- and flagella-associated protein 45-like [Lytechinus pictus]|uniref:cilia- and flagella-associated protein 45-like n=1 Tax=Lytechinus pictus TaxID=7653 RepID=UPI00240D3F80|nr:cilia- and flagella-associated protein 45-like [Lytechinus pictus]